MRLRKRFGKKVAGFAKKVGRRTLKAGYGVAKRVARGQSIRAAVGSQLRRELQTIVGKGAYSMTRSSGAMRPRRRYIRGRGAYSESSGSIMPSATDSMIAGEDGCVVLRRSEYLGDVFSGPLAGSYSQFTAQTYYVNPGLSLDQGGASNWLAPVGASFQQYKYNKLLFEFVSTSGNAISSTNSSLGTVIMCCQYDSSRKPFPNKQQMMDSQFAKAFAPSKTEKFPVECKASREAMKLYDIRTGPLTASQSQNTYDFVQFQIATQGCQAAGINLGEIWVHYEVVLDKPNTNNVGTLMPQANYTWTNNISGQGTAPSGSSPLGNSTTKLVASPTNQLPLTFIQTSGGTAQVNLPDTIQQGVFFFEFYWRGSATASISPPTFSASASGNCELQNLVIFSPNSAGQLPSYSTPSTTATIAYCSCYLKINAGGMSVDGAVYGNGVVLANGTIPSSCTDLQIVVTQVNQLVLGNGL